MIPVLKSIRTYAVCLACAGYMILVVVYLPLRLLTLGYPKPVWWVLYLLSDAIAFAIPIALVLWFWVWLPAKREGRPALLSRFASMIGMLLAPLFAFFVIPAGFFASMPGTTGSLAGWSVFAIAMLALIALWAYFRYLSPRRIRKRSDGTIEVYRP